MKIQSHIRHCLGLLAVAAWSATLPSLSAQAPDGPGGSGFGGRGPRGIGSPIPRDQMEKVNRINSELAAESAAVTVASSNLVAASFSTPKDDAKISEANNALKNARLAWAMKASSLFSQVQATTNKLNEAAISMLVASSTGGRGALGGFGGRGGPSAGRPANNQDPGMVFSRPTDSPGLGQAITLPSPDADGFVAMWNGQDLTGWDALPNFWSVKNGVIDCVETEGPGGNVQSDLTWIDSRDHPERYGNFEFRVKFRWLSHSGNSGIQIRGKIDNAATKHIAGYQADMDPANAYTGALYDEGGASGRHQNEVGGPHMGPRGFKVTYPADGGTGKAEPLAENAEKLAGLVKPVAGEFNDMVIIADGPHITIKVNDHTFCEVIDQSERALKNGIIAFQQHAGAQMEIQFKDPKIKFLSSKGGNTP